MKLAGKFTTAIFVIPILSVLTYGLYLYYHIQVWTYPGPTQPFQIKAGESFSKINYRLKKNGIISNATIFYRLARINGVIKKFRKGSYSIEKGKNMTAIMNLFTMGTGSDIRITIPEGKNISLLSDCYLRQGDGGTKAAHFRSKTCFLM